MFRLCSLVVTFVSYTFIQVLADLEEGFRAKQEDSQPNSKAPSAGEALAKDSASQPQKKRRLSRNEKLQLKAEQKIVGMEKEGLQAELKEKALSMYKHGILALPPLAWDGDSEDEKQAVREIGMLFQAYGPEAWSFELYEMARKLMMTAMLVFIYEGEPGQVGAGMIITFISLMYVQRNQPFSTAQLNNMAVFSFIGQLATLFYGLLNMAQTAGKDDELDGVIMGYLIAAINISVVLMPFIEMEGMFDGLVRSLGRAVAVMGALLCLLLKKSEPAEAKTATDFFVRACSDAQLADMQSGSPWQAAYTTLLHKHMSNLFDKIDKDRSGSISKEELLHAAKDISSEEHVFQIFEKMDTDLSGQISRVEFLSYFSFPDRSRDRSLSSRLMSSSEPVVLQGRDMPILSTTNETTDEAVDMTRSTGTELYGVLHACTVTTSRQTNDSLDACSPITSPTKEPLATLEHVPISFHYGSDDVSLPNDVSSKEDHRPVCDEKMHEKTKEERRETSDGKSDVTNWLSTFFRAGKQTKDNPADHVTAFLGFTHNIPAEESNLPEARLIELEHEERPPHPRKTSFLA